MAAKDDTIEMIESSESGATACHVDNQKTPDPHVQSYPEDELRGQLLWSRIRHYCREPFAEFFGTMILILFGDGVVAQVTLSNGQKGSYQSISWGWGYASRALMKMAS